MRSNVTENFVKVAVAALSLCALAGCAHGPNRSARPHEEHPWRSPIIDALDANHDGIIDAAEIANAPAALKTLDKNKDGQLSYDDVHWPDRREQEGDPEPVIQVLDANHDDVIDANEIANAPAALRKLDKNGDGQLTPDEYSPPPPLRPVGHGMDGTQDRSPAEHGRRRGPRDDSQSPPVGGQP
ncbi:MAG: EF-hand domain-containing protein [Verrucomicrobiia bacterium]|jgi:hypothetical protein